MNGQVTRDQVVAGAVIKWFRRVIQQYHGPAKFGQFKAYLMQVLNEKNLKADEILAEAAQEIL